jgi:hypothetical protein
MVEGLDPHTMNIQGLTRRKFIIPEGSSLMSFLRMRTKGVGVTARSATPEEGRGENDRDLVPSVFVLRLCV